MKAYFVAKIRVRDTDEYQRYLDCVDEVFAKFNGKYLAVDEHPEALEGEWDDSRLVLIEFPDKQSLKAWYNSDAHQRILQFRLAGAHCDAVVVEGLPS